LQWTGPSPQQDPSIWQAIDYKHDVYGRRSEKKVDGFSTRYLYDGPQVIAECDGNNNLLRKYIYGPGIDQPVCMIEQAESETYYYHYDALGSVVALSDSSGDTVQTYEYSIFGQVAAEDVDHPNPYMFAGRRFDIEIGLYYNRARYYNPFTGRFLQADPKGYEAGMNLYSYCYNNPVVLQDPSGCDPCDPCDPCDSGIADWLDLFYYPAWRGDNVIHLCEFTGIVCILPGALENPESLASGRALARFFRDGLIFDLMAWPNVGETLGAAIEAWGKQLENYAVKASESGQYGWKAYILVQEYEWKVTGIIWKEFEKVAIGEPYWVEVRGYEGWHDPGIEIGNSVSDYTGFTGKLNYGYTSAEYAVRAAQIAGDIFYCRGETPTMMYTCRAWRDLIQSQWCPRHRMYNCPICNNT